MIRTRSDLKKYLAADSIYYKQQTTGFIKRLKWNLFSNPVTDNHLIWKYIFVLRNLEFHTNNCNKLRTIYYSWKLKKISVKTGFQIPPNVCGPGLVIYHYGSIIVNDKAKIGHDVILNPNVVIGHKKPNEGAPSIGNNVFIGAGAKVIGKVFIGDNAIIAPNAVVVRDVPAGSVVGGVPASFLR